MALPFLKMHGLGNDFVLIDDLGKPPALEAKLTPELVRRICDRRFGVGADQLLWMRTPSGSGLAEARMEILNADGSTAEMCGNGIRAAALYLSRHGPKPHQASYAIETLAGVKRVALREEGLVEVDMGEPRVLGHDSVEAGGRTWRFREVSLGNPHAVIFWDGDVRDAPVESAGPLIERHSRFPNRTNVEFVEVRGDGGLRVRVWERGAGATLACGTGACASAVAAIAEGRARGAVQVELPGGTLSIRWEGAGSSVFMEGPAEEVFRGDFYL